MDKVLKEALSKDENRHKYNIELIASENFVSKDVLELQGSILTNKYAEGYPGNRYYGGCEYIDIFENKAIEYATKLFDCKYANVQPHSGSSANMAVYRALLEKGDTILGMDLNEGGHLTHGHKMSFSGQDYNVISYGVTKDTETIDYDELEEKAIIYKPKLIVAGASAYSRVIDFRRFKEIASKIGALLMVDMSHIAGLVAAKEHPSPIPYADVVTTTTHKTLRGPRGGMILTNDEEIIKKINKTVFPGIQGGPLMHVIAAKAECLYEALEPEFKTYIKEVKNNAKVLADTLKNNGFRIISNGTDNHLLLVDVKSVGLTGLEAEELLDNISITVNKNVIPFDTEKPKVTSGIRLGSAAMTTRGFNEEDYKEVGDIISKCLLNKDDEKIQDELKTRVYNLVSKYI